MKKDISVKRLCTRVTFDVIGETSQRSIVICYTFITVVSCHRSMSYCGPIHDSAATHTACDTINRLSRNLV